MLGVWNVEQPGSYSCKLGKYFMDGVAVIGLQSSFILRAEKTKDGNYCLTWPHRNASHLVATLVKQDQGLAAYKICSWIYEILNGQKE